MVLFYSNPTIRRRCFGPVPGGGGYRVRASGAWDACIMRHGQTMPFFNIIETFLLKHGNLWISLRNS